MKVITIKQPWASLIAEGYKIYEFRTWNTKYRGEILIHAGKSIDKKAMKKFAEYNLEYPTGCIIAKATITDSIYVDNDFVAKISKINPLVYHNVIDQKEGKLYGFKLEKVSKIEPIYLDGQLGLWNYKNE